MRLPGTVAERTGRAGNLAPQLRLARRFLPYAVALFSGVMLTTAFPPLSIPAMAWLALVPLLAVALRPNAPAFRLGWLFGLGHFATAFAFLNEVMPGTSVALAALCGLFTAGWLKIAAEANRHLCTPEFAELHPRHDPALPTMSTWGPGRECLQILFIAVSWVAFEWVRSWIFSGFPWNPLGVSQWRNRLILDIIRAWGVPAVSFLVAAGNAAIYFAGRNWLQRQAAFKLGEPSRHGYSAGLAMFTLLLALAWMGRSPLRLPPPDASLPVACVQANLPQIRAFTEDELADAIRIHFQLSREAAEQHPALIVWPETAIPASLTANADLALAFQALRRETGIPYLIGTIDYRPPPGSDSLTAARGYNSAALYEDVESPSPTALVDKAHLVPFGEYVPFEEWFPFVSDWIGMGRSLTPGAGMPILPLPGNPPHYLGVLICYEDIFPELAAKAVAGGAQALVVLTNDVWFGQTSGAEQHRINGLMRAVETGLPMLRAGNNSETMLILPTGTIVNPLRDPDTHSSFYRGFRIYDLPIWNNLPPAPAIRRGPIIARLSAAATLLLAMWCLWRTFNRRRKLLAIVMPDVE